MVDDAWHHREPDLDIIAHFGPTLSTLHRASLHWGNGPQARSPVKVTQYDPDAVLRLWGTTDADGTEWRYARYQGRTWRCRKADLLIEQTPDADRMAYNLTWQNAEVVDAHPPSEDVT